MSHPISPLENPFADPPPNTSGHSDERRSSPIDLESGMQLGPDGLRRRPSLAPAQDASSQQPRDDVSGRGSDPLGSANVTSATVNGRLPLSGREEQSRGGPWWKPRTAEERERDRQDWWASRYLFSPQQFTLEQRIALSHNNQNSFLQPLRQFAGETNSVEDLKRAINFCANTISQLMERDTTRSRAAAAETRSSTWYAVLTVSSAVSAMLCDYALTENTKNNLRAEIAELRKDNADLQANCSGATASGLNPTVTLSKHATSNVLDSRSPQGLVSDPTKVDSTGPLDLTVTLAEIVDRTATTDDDVAGPSDVGPSGFQLTADQLEWISRGVELSQEASEDPDFGKLLKDLGLTEDEAIETARTLGEASLFLRERLQTETEAETAGP